MTRTCVIVSPYFPPSTLAGVHRARHLAKHLPANGWTPIVVAVDEAFHEQQLDFGLAALVPSSVEVVKTNAIPKKYCRQLGLGDISLRAWWPLRDAVNNLLSTRDVSAVLITGSPYYPMLFSANIRRRFRVPLILDFQDPWVSGRGPMFPSWSKGWLSHKLALALEPKAVRSADFITSVSEQQNDELLMRYPWLERSRMAAIPIGGDPEDYNALPGSTLDKDAGIGRSDGCFHIVYAGTIWPPVLGTLRTVLRALKLVREQAPDLYFRLRLGFIGTTANPNETQDYRVMPIAEAEGVADIVHEVPRRLPYLDALALQASSNAILVLGSSEPHYTASKIFGVLMSGRPYISLFHKRSSAHEMLSRAGGGVSLAFETQADLNELVDTLAKNIIQLSTDPVSFGTADPAAYASYTAHAVAGQFARVFDSVAHK